MPSGESGCSAFPFPYRCERATCAPAKAGAQTGPRPSPGYKIKSEPRDPETESRGWRPILLSDLGDNPRADRTAALADREAQARVHRDRGDQLDAQIHVVARHHHLGALRELHLTGDVGRPEVELRTVVGEERRVTAALVLRQDVDLGAEVGVRLDRARLAKHLAALDVLTADAAQQRTDIVASLALVEQLAEHLDAGDDRLLGVADADDFDFLANLDDALLDTAGDDGAAARDREHVLDRHQERLVERTLRGRDPLVDGIHELEDRLLADLRVLVLE